MSSNVKYSPSNGVHPNKLMGDAAAYLEDDDVVVDGGAAAHVGKSGRDFYSEDYYDYKDTFGGRNGGQTTATAAVQRQAFDDIDEEEDDDDENNDFKTGPLARRHDDDDDDVEEGGGGGGIAMGEDYDDDGNQHSFYAEHEFDGVDDEEQGDLLMMDTFFKRVDSQELVKPKKAKIISNYLIGELLGDGSYGKVKECLDIRDLSRCAVKIINLKMVARKIPRGVENVRKEISIMRRLNHKNIIKLHDTFEKGPMSALPPSYGNYNRPGRADAADEETPAMSRFGGGGGINSNDPLAVTTAMMAANAEKPPKIYIFMDYCMTSLEKLLKTAPDQRLRNYQANFYFRQLVDGLEYLHSLNIIHNDIKPGNLLITCDNTLKICDFSISAELKVFHEYELMANWNDNSDDGQAAYGGKGGRDDDYRINPDLLTNVNTSTNRFPILQCTPMFQCPEMLAENMDELMILKNAPKIDIWSSGITLYQLTTGVLPFKGQTIHQIYENIRSNVIQMPEFIDKNLSRLIMAMLDREPIQRWSLKQIKDCEWFKKKHPVIQEELAPLPVDVLQNETSTFRMLQYLEKLCQQNDPSLDPEIVEAITKNSSLINANLQQLQQQQQQVDFIEAATARHSSATNAQLPPNAEAGHVIRYDSKQNHLPVQTTNNHMQQQQQQLAPVSNGNGAALKHSMESKTFSQATKLKKNHCLLM